MDEAPDRDWKQALLLGLRNRCPSCGRAPLFARTLKPFAACPACGQDWTHHRADDFPAYLVILILGHLLVPVMVMVNLTWDLAVGWQMAAWPALAALCALIMLRPIKGAVIAMQWALGMGGFARA